MRAELLRLAGVGVAIFFFLGATQSLYGPLVPGLRAEFDLSSSIVGLLFSAHGFGELLGVLAPAFVSSRMWAGRYALTIATLLILLGAAAFALAVTWLTLIAAVFVFALGFGVHVGRLNALFVTGFGARNGSMSQLINAGFSIGSILGPLVVAYWTHTSRDVFYIVALLSALLLPAAWLIDLKHSQPASTPHAQRTPGHKNTMVIAGFILVMLLTVGVESSVGAWTTSLAKARGLEFATAARFTSIFFGGIFVGRMITAFLGRAWDAALTVIVAIAAITALLVAANFEAGAPVCFALTGLAIAPTFSATLVWLTQSVTHVQRASALVIAGAIFGSALFPPLVGLAIDHGGMHAAAPTILVIAIAALVAALVLRATTPLAKRETAQTPAS